MKGFPRSNLTYMRAFAEAYEDGEIIQRCVRNTGGREYKILGNYSSWVKIYLAVE
ncbi:MAG: DUF1016 domain-containing protein [Leptolyngbyaceae cyanobacterium CSU_1_3]|nr:DUF1016 domain-containing protein [Leptolyngbyaceae cyanobacterium CSU_1_3]